MINRPLLFFLLIEVSLGFDRPPREAGVPQQKINCVTSSGGLGLCEPYWNCSSEMKEYTEKCSSHHFSCLCCSDDVASSDQQDESEIKTSGTLSPPNCGESFSVLWNRILGGRESFPDEWPWAAVLGYKRKRKPGINWFCGGALINDKYVITAAHCIKTDHLGLTLSTVRLGDNELSDESKPGMIEVGVQSTLIHPDYNEHTKHNDIGLVKLDHSLNFSRSIYPICLPKSSIMRSADYVGSTAIVAGWGTVSEGGPTSNKLLQTQVPVVKNEKCYDSYKEKKAVIIDRQLCAGYPQGGKDACQGDSGGPMMLSMENFYYVIGIISYGYGCGKPGYPGVYTRVSSYYDWLSTYLNQTNK